MNKSFKCEGDNLEQIPEAIIQRTGLVFPMVHQDGLKMANLAQELKHDRQDLFCRVPFCVTVEAEALGAQIKLGDEKFGPRVESYAYDTLEAMLALPSLDFEKGRLCEVLRSVTTLAQSGENVVLNVEGPFSILSSLIEPMVFYKAIKKDKEAANKVLSHLEDCIFEYAVAGLQCGARVISYGDPVGAMDIVGPKVYKDVAGPSTYKLLKRIEAYVKANDLSALIHLCGKTSASFESVGLCKLEAVPVQEDVTYGQALYEVFTKSENVMFIGNACIKRTPLKVKDHQIWRVELL